MKNIKNKINKLQEKFENNKLTKRAKKVLIAMIVSVLSIVPQSVLASSINVNMDLDEKAAFGGLILVAITIAKYVGYFLVVAGVFGFIEAQQSENPERKNTSIKGLAVGAALIGGEFLLRKSGIIS